MKLWDMVTRSRKRDEGEKDPLSRARWWRSGAIAMALVPVLGCGRGSESTPDPFPAFAHSPPDTAWIVIEGVEFPQGMEDSDPEILEAYVFAAQHPEVLRYMPCYCGCQRRRQPHQSNYDCFVDIIDRSGPRPRVSPDLMGFT